MGAGAKAEGPFLLPGVSFGTAQAGLTFGGETCSLCGVGQWRAGRGRDAAQWAPRVGAGKDSCCNWVVKQAEALLCCAT